MSELMNAAVVHEFGAPLRIEEAGIPAGLDSYVEVVKFPLAGADGVATTSASDLVDEI